MVLTRRSLFAMCRFTIAFCLLLRDTDAEYEWDRPHQYQTLLESMIGVVRLTLGDFGAASFNLSTTRPILTYSALLLFIFFVPIVLLNALIAIMVRNLAPFELQLAPRHVRQCRSVAGS
jgi:hypothetical protein